MEELDISVHDVFSIIALLENDHTLMKKFTLITAKLSLDDQWRPLLSEKVLCIARWAVMNLLTSNTSREVLALYYDSLTFIAQQLRPKDVGVEQSILNLAELLNMKLFSEMICERSGVLDHSTSQEVYYNAIKLCKKHGKASLVELSNIMKMDTKTTTRIINWLVGAGLLRKHIELTETFFTIDSLQT